MSYDVWYDPNEIDADNRAHLLRSWARPDLDITCGRVILLGDDELEPVPARIVSFDDTTGIITVEILYDQRASAVA